MSEADRRWTADEALERLRAGNERFLDTLEGRARVEEGVLRLVGAVYDLKTGRVRFLSWSRRPHGP